MTDINILIVDDDAGTRETLSDIFSEKGYCATPVATAGEALEEAKKLAFEIALIDIKLPDMDGIALLKELKSMCPDTLCVVVTGHASRENAISALKSGADDYFIKPLDIDEVCRRTELALEKISLARKLVWSEEKFRSVFESSSDAIMLLDEEGFIDCNGATLKVFGLKSKGDFLGRHPGELSPPRQTDGRNSVEAADEKMAVALREGRNSFEWTHIRADGSPFPAEVILTAFSLEGRGIMQATVRDITEKKRAADDLERLFNLSGSMACIIDFNGYFTRVSPAFTEVLGYTPEELLSRPVLDFIHSDDQKRTLEAREEKLKRGLELLDFENRYICRDGSIKWLSWTSRSIPADNIILAIAYDVTSRKNDERAFEALLKTTSGAMGPEFFEGLVGEFSKWLGVDCCSVSEFVEGRARVVAMICDDEYIKEYEYDLAGSPCEKVREGGYCAFNEGVSELFPEVGILKDFKAEGYVGAALMDREGESIGILNAISRTPLKLPPRAQEVFSIMAARVSAELERRKAGEALKDSEEMMRAISETAQDAIIIIDDYGKVMYWNPSAVDIFGYSEDEAIGMPFTDLVVVDNAREGLLKKLSEFRETGECKMLARTVEMRAIKKDGTVFPIEHAISAVSIGGKCHAIGMMKDITQRKHMEEVLKKGEAQLSLIYQTVGNILFFLSVEPGEKYRFLSVNQAFIEATGLSEDRIIGKDIEEVIPASAITMVRDNYSKAIFEKRIIRWEETSLFPSGKKTGDVSVAPVFNENGVCTNLVGSIHDITRRKEAEEMLIKEADITKNLLKITEATAQTENLDELMESIVSGVGSIAGSNISMIYLRDEDTKLMMPVSASGLDSHQVPSFRTHSISMDAPFMRDILNDGPAFISDSSGDFSDWLTGIDNLAVIPLKGKKTFFGLLVQAYRERRWPEDGGEAVCTERDRSIFQGIGHHVSLAIEKSMHAREAIDRTMELSHKIETIEVMHGIDKTILSTLDPMEIRRTVVNMIARLVPCDRSTVRLVDRERGGFVFAAGYGGESIVDKNFVPFNETSAYEVVEYLRPQYISDLSKVDKPLPFEQMSLKAGYLSHIRVPLIVKSEITGVLHLASKRAAAFVPEDLKTLDKLSTQIVMALENSRLVTDLEKLLISTIMTLSDTIDAKSPWTRGHSERVTAIALRIGEKMGVPEKRLKRFEIGGLLHDIGKIGTYEGILNKPGKLTAEETSELRKHPAKGAEILSNISQLEDIIPVVRHHHEFYDGTGYPDGLRGEDISLEARILSVADTVDAMASDRPYRKGRPMRVILDELRKFSGKQFDPEVVRVFLELAQKDNNGFLKEMNLQGRP